MAKFNKGRHRDQQIADAIFVLAIVLILILIN